MRNAFQSTHPRGVRPQARQRQQCPSLVSIHAPAWGATPYKAVALPGKSLVSIHAPAWGATHPPPWCGRDRDGFNPRTRVGCDDAKRNYQSQARKFQSTHPRGVRRVAPGHTVTRFDVSIHAPAWGATGARRSRQVSTTVSIHAPAWGATLTVFDRVRMMLVSIHAPAWGATGGVHRHVPFHLLFQSTHPRGVRRCSWIQNQRNF